MNNDKEFEKFLKANEKLIYYMMKKYQNNIFSKEELYSWGMFVMWKCWKAFDATRGVKFSSLFGVAFDRYVMCEGRKRGNKSKHEQIFVELDKVTDEVGNCTISDVVASEVNVEEQVVLSQHVNECLDKLTPKEKEICLLLGKGYSQKIVGEKVGYTQSHTSRVIKRIKRKLGDMLNA